MEFCFLQDGVEVPPEDIEPIAQLAAAAGVPIVFASGLDLAPGTIMRMGRYRVRIVRRATKAEEIHFRTQVQLPPYDGPGPFYYELASD